MTSCKLEFVLTFFCNHCSHHQCLSSFLLPAHIHRNQMQVLCLQRARHRSNGSTAAEAGLIRARRHQCQAAASCSPHPQQQAPEGALARGHGAQQWALARGVYGLIKQRLCPSLLAWAAWRGCAVGFGSALSPSTVLPSSPKQLP